VNPAPAWSAEHNSKALAKCLPSTWTLVMNYLSPNSEANGRTGRCMSASAGVVQLRLAEAMFTSTAGRSSAYRCNCQSHLKVHCGVPVPASSDTRSVNCYAD
jgi:hypothetical protein